MQPKLCLYFIDNYFEPGIQQTHLQYDYELSKDSKTQDYQVKNYLSDKRKIETLFGRFGIGEILTSELGYTFKLKRQILFQKNSDEIIFNPKVLDF